jgi:hypothetical protein
MRIQAPASIRESTRICGASGRASISRHSAGRYLVVVLIGNPTERPRLVDPFVRSTECIQYTICLRIKLSLAALLLTGDATGDALNFIGVARVGSDKLAECLCLCDFPFGADTIVLYSGHGYDAEP